MRDTKREMLNMDIILRTDTSGCPWGRDIIEAMSSGKPVIAAGDSQVFIEHGKTGLLYPPCDIDKMAENIFLLAQNKVKRQNMGTSAYNFAKENFDAENNTQKILAILDNLIAASAVK